MHVDRTLKYVNMTMNSSDKPVTIKLENARYNFLRFGLFITAVCPECALESSWRYSAADAVEPTPRPILRLIK